MRLLCLSALQQAWSSRAQQILVPTWQQVTSVPAPPTTLGSDTVTGSQRLGDWGWETFLSEEIKSPGFIIRLLFICIYSYDIQYSSVFIFVLLPSGGTLQEWLHCSNTACSLPWMLMIHDSYMTGTVLWKMVLKAFGLICNVRFSYCRKVRPHGNHYSSMIAHPQPFLTNQMTMSTHQPINIGIAHVVWPQPAANKRAKPCVNRYSTWAFALSHRNICAHAFPNETVTFFFSFFFILSVGAATSPKTQTSKI